MVCIKISGVQLIYVFQKSGIKYAISDVFNFETNNEAIAVLRNHTLKVIQVAFTFSQIKVNLEKSNFPNVPK